jgi:hypothetical protein
MNQKTNMTSDHYVRNMGLVCPCCESEDIAATGPMESDAGIAWSERQCSRCKARWMETYGLVGYSGLTTAGITKEH